MYSPEQLVKEAKEHGCDLSLAEAAKAIEKMEISEDDLQAVSGGTVYDALFTALKKAGKK